MKKFLALIYSVVLTLALALFVGCKKTPEEKLTLTLDKQTAKIGVFEEITLIPSFSDGTVRKLTWTTSNQAVATVENGVVTGVGLGTATVKAENGELSASCEITVIANAEILVETNLLDNAVNLVVGKAGVTVVSTVYYGGMEVENATLSYQSENASVATVDLNGLITPVAKGTANVIVTANVGGVVGERIIAVSVANDNQVEVTAQQTLFAKDFAQDGSTPNTVQIQPVLTVNGIAQTDVAFTYTVRDNTIATVDANGKVTAIKAGTAYIDIKTTLANGEEVSSFVTVNVKKTHFILPDTTVVKLEKYALYDTDLSMTYLDLSVIDDYVKAEELVGVKDGLVAVQCERKGDKFHIKNQELGVYEYTFETEYAFVTVQCEYTTEQFIMLQGNTHLNPYYAHDTYKEHSQYTSLMRTKIVDGYAELDWKSQVKDGADVMAFYNKISTKTNGDSGDIAFNFASDVTNINPLDYDYIAFDIRAYKSGASVATEPIKLGVKINDVTDWDFLPGEKLSNSSFGSVGKIGKIVDANGEDSAYRMNEWQTMVFDISQIQSLTNDYYGVGGRFLRIILNEVSIYNGVAITNIRLMSKQMYDLTAFSTDFGTDAKILTPSAQLTPSVEVGGKLADITLQSSDETIAKVENGKFSFLGEGEVTLSLTFNLVHGGAKTVSKTFSVYAEDNYEVDFGFEGDEFENTATPTVKIMGQEITDFTLNSSAPTIVKVDGQKFMACANGEATISISFTLANGEPKTVNKTVTAKFVPQRTLSLNNTANPYVEALKNYSQYQSYKRELVTSDYTELGDWSSIVKEDADILAFTWNIDTKSTGDSGEIAFSFAGDGANVNALIYDYIEFDMFVYKTENSTAKLAWSFNDSGRIWEFTEGSNMSDVSFGKYGKIANMYNANGTETAFAYGQWIKVRFDITGLEKLATAFGREGGALIKIIFDGASKNDIIAFANLSIGVNE